MPPFRHRALDANSAGYFALLAGFALFALAGAGAAWYMEHEGHYVTGMSNQIVWGMPHVFAIFLIVAASGALNVASIASVFGKLEYKPLARLSAILAVALLVGGLAILVLDLGRPDRLIVAMTYYNFKSIFAWNIFLYIGFIFVAAAYLWTMFERRMGRWNRGAGIAALLWRLVLTTGTGSIFGFLVARQAYDAALMAPMFVAMSFSYGLAVFILVLMASSRLARRPLGGMIVHKLKNLLGVFVAAVLYFVVAFNLTNLYAAEHRGVEDFLLASGGVYPLLFWGVQVGAGGLLPLLLFYAPPLARSRAAAAAGCALVVAGAFAQLYVIIIGGQAYPLVLFPGMEESSSFFDGVVAGYTPSLPELALGAGGVALSLALLMFALAVLDFLPEDLSDSSFNTAAAAAR